jgi:RecB family exonuclease
MGRKTKEELDALMKQENVLRLWSYSRINCFQTSPYEYMLRYLLHKKEDRQDCIYTSTGSLAHDILEKLYTNKITYEEMDNEFEDGWITLRNLAQLKFDRNDMEKDEKISNKYYEDLKHFFKNHTKIKHKTAIEEFIKIRVGNNNILIGYIDCCFKDNEGCYNIIDFKSSSEYKNKVLEEHSAQLTLYAIGLMQLGVPKECIKIAFNFLKYCNVEVTQKNKKKKLRSIERCCLGESLCSNAKMWLKEYGYDKDEIDNYLKQMIDSNSIECLPKEIQDKFVISDRYVYIDLTDDLIEKWTNNIITTIKDIELREKDYKETHNEKIWWDSEESVKAQSYYFATLSGYSPNLHKPYAEYLNKLEAQKNGNDLFANIGSSVTSTSKDICNDKKNDNNMDLSWLDDIV